MTTSDYMWPTWPNKYSVTEIIPGVYLGGVPFPKNIDVSANTDASPAHSPHMYMRELQLDGILSFTTEQVRWRIPVKYMHIVIDDVPSADIDLDACADFIESVRRARGGNGRILVHCRMGVSRSSTALIAWLVKYKMMSVPDAYRLVVARRWVMPNVGFLHKLFKWRPRTNHIYNNRLHNSYGR
jgi:predicted protein tyrosine phosphatase